MDKTLIMITLMGAVLGIIIGTTGATWIWIAVVAIIIGLIGFGLHTKGGGL